MILGLGLGLPRQRLTGAFQGLLDLYPGAAAAYSVRQLSTSATLSMRVRKEVSTVSEETDIGFVNNELDTAALLAFASNADNGDVFVVTWYDQAGSVPPNNATNSTAASQPKIVSSGAVVLENGKPCLDFDGTSDYLSLGGTEDAGLLGDISIFCVNKSSTNTRTLVSTGRTATSNASQIQWGLNQGSGVYAIETSDGTTAAEVIGSAATGSQALTTVINDESANLSLFVDGASDGTTGAVSPMNDMAQPLEIGRDPWRDSLYFVGTMQELVMYASAQSSNNRLDIEENIANHFGIALTQPATWSDGQVWDDYSVWSE